MKAHQPWRVLLLAGVCATLALAAAGARAPVDIATPVARAATTSTAAKPSFAELTRTIARSKRLLGSTVRPAARLASTAGKQARRRDACGSVRTLTKLGKRVRAVKALAARPVVGEILGIVTALQAQQLQTPAGRRTRCGLKPAKLVVGGQKPRLVSLPPLTSGGPSRPVARLGRGDFISNELIVQTASRSALNGLLKRWNGTVLSETGPPRGTRVYLVRIDPSKASPEGLQADLLKLDPLARGTHRVSNAQGLDLVTAAADEAARGLTIGINAVPRAQTFTDRVIREGPAGPKGYDPNPFNLSYMKHARDGSGMNIGVAEAWRQLAGAGKLSNKVKIAVIDGGFAPGTDLDPAWPGQTGTPNPGQCSGGVSCPWHGTNTAATVGALTDNAFGVAGSAGPVADLVLIPSGITEFEIIDAIYEAFDAKAKIINLSLGYEIDALVSWAQVPIEDATQSAEERGILVVAAAGNAGRDVDAEDCFIACWEEEWIAPCENDGVLCVGGMNDGYRSRATNSNYGFEWCEKAPCDVDIFGPWTVMVPPDPANNGTRWVGGTSFASPFVAGVAALVWAASPSLTPHQVELALVNNANSSSDKQVGLTVNAYRAVRSIITNSPPLPKIYTPPGSGPYGKLNLFTFVAAADDDEDGKNCCTFSWSSDKDGQLGTGAKLEFAFGSPGKRTLTVTAIDKSGGKGTTTTTFEATNQGPKVSIEAPAFGAQLFRNIPYTLAATATDPNEDLPCSALTWSFSGPGSMSATGCNPVVTFMVNGTWQMSVTVKDSQGAQTTVGRTVSVVDAPLNKPPIVTITAPTPGLVLDANAVRTLTGSAVDPDGKATPTYRWRVQRLSGGPTYQIGTAASIQWRPRDTFGISCSNFTVRLTLEATDPDGTGTATVDVVLGYPPC